MKHFLIVFTSGSTVCKYPVDAEDETTALNLFFQERGLRSFEKYLGIEKVPDTLSFTAWSNSRLRAFMTDANEQ